MTAKLALVKMLFSCGLERVDSSPNSSKVLSNNKGNGDNKDMVNSMGPETAYLLHGFLRELTEAAKAPH